MPKRTTRVALSINLEQLRLDVSRSLNQPFYVAHAPTGTGFGQLRWSGFVANTIDDKLVFRRWEAVHPDSGARLTRGGNGFDRHKIVEVNYQEEDSMPRGGAAVSETQGNGAAQPAQPTPIVNQAPIQVTIRGVVLEFWGRINHDRGWYTCMVRKQGRPQEEYPVFTVRDRGDCFRHPGLPLGWGLRLTKDRKIKEVR